jgi:hypothetical protein
MIIFKLWSGHETDRQTESPYHNTSCHRQAYKNKLWVMLFGVVVMVTNKNKLWFMLCLEWLSFVILFTIHKKNTSTSVLHLDDNKIRGHTACTARHQPSTTFLPLLTQIIHNTAIQTSNGHQYISNYIPEIVAGLCATNFS